MKKIHITKLVAFAVFMLLQVSSSFGSDLDSSLDEAVNNPIACISSLSPEEQSVFHRQLLQIKQDFVSEGLLNENQNITRKDLSGLLMYSSLEDSRFDFKTELVKKGNYTLTYRAYIDFCESLATDYSNLDFSPIPFICKEIDGATLSALRLFNLNASAQCEKLVQNKVHQMREIIQSRPLDPTVLDLSILAQNYETLKNFTKTYAPQRYPDEIIGESIVNVTDYFLSGKAFSDLYSKLPDERRTAHIINGIIFAGSIWCVYARPLLERIISY